MCIIAQPFIVAKALWLGTMLFSKQEVELEGSSLSICWHQTSQSKNTNSCFSPALIYGSFLNRLPSEQRAGGKKKAQP